MMVSMTHSLGRLAVVTTALTLLSSGLAGCGLLDGSTPVEDALEYLPASTTALTFTDRAAMDDRLDLDDLATPASEDELADWGRAQQDEGYGTELSAWVAVMQKAAFSDLDVEWEASGTSVDDGRVRVWKLDDDVDFGKIADDLEDAGYEHGTSGDVETFETSPESADESGLYGGRYPGILTSLALVPDEHLVLSGAVELAIDVANDDEDSLSDEGSFDDLLDRAPDAGDLEYAALSLEGLCGLGDRVTPEQAAREFEGLSHPDRGEALFADPDAVTAVRLFSDDNDAESDAKGLETYLDERASTRGFDVGLDVQADGDAVTAEGSFDDRRAMVQAWSRADGPFACPLGK
ncbi:hypothetical protein CFH99_06795 [Nocardioides aromaticivorans]|uniref:Uncharacterized protein n=2 Tax=Nocardioides aromaticivorans TaxID=200618 RepID=A0ABX7PHJ7_9ACTN|nr:hypothetical protein CFH99_06795 [Nocardioides aromaticivorans]